MFVFTWTAALQAERKTKVTIAIIVGNTDSFFIGETPYIFPN
jgi:hypothetical protein